MNKKYYFAEWNRKDSLPEDTIYRIKNKLNMAGITTAITDVKQYNNIWYSCRVYIVDFPFASANGKGVSYEYAVASAYGELIERLLSGTLIHEYFPNQRLKKTNSKITEDIIQQYYSIMFENNSECTDDDLIASANTHSDYFEPFPYIAEDSTKVLLPDRFVYYLCGTNGLSSGNTYEEAFVQATCEIIERHVLRVIYDSRYSEEEFPDISDSLLVKTKSFSLVKAIREAGYVCKVKDCSLGGLYPVVGILLQDKSRTRHLFKLGCDPDFDICLQRCVTEIFQGSNLDAAFYMHMRKTFEPDNNIWNVSRSESSGFLNSIYDGTGSIPFSLLKITNDIDEYPKAFLLGEYENKECALYLRSLLIKNNYHFYVRDYSANGLVAIRVYIPGMSEVFKYQGFLQVMDAIAKVKSSDRIASDELYDLLGKILNYPPYQERAEYSKITGILTNHGEAIELQSMHFHYGLLALSQQDYDIAKTSFRKVYSELYGMNGDLYESIIECIIDGIREGIDITIIENIIEQIAINNKLHEVIHRFIAYYKSNYQFMKCDNCQKCPLIDKCSYYEWATLCRKLQFNNREQ